MIALGVGLMLLAILLVWLGTAGWQTHVQTTHTGGTASGQTGG